MSMSSYHRRILEKIAPDLLNDLDVGDVIPHLVADEVLTRNDVQKVNSNATSRDKVSALLDIIPRRGAGAYLSFQNSLMKTDGSMHLYQTMKHLEQEVPCDPSNDQPPMTEECTDSWSRDVPMSDASELDTGLLNSIDPWQPANPPQPANPWQQANPRQPANPNKLLKDQNFLDLAKGLGEHSQTLAISLGLTRADFYHCQVGNQFNPQGQTFDMLYKWKSKNGRKATVSALLSACRSIEVLDEEVYEFLYNL